MLYHFGALLTSGRTGIFGILLNHTNTQISSTPNTEK